MAKTLHPEWRNATGAYTDRNGVARKGLHKHNILTGQDISTREYQETILHPGVRRPANTGITRTNIKQSPEVIQARKLFRKMGISTHPLLARNLKKKPLGEVLKTTNITPTRLAALTGAARSQIIEMSGKRRVKLNSIHLNEKLEVIGKRTDGEEMKVMLGTRDGTTTLIWMPRSGVQKFQRRIEHLLANPPEPAEPGDEEYEEAEVEIIYDWQFDFM